MSGDLLRLQVQLSGECCKRMTRFDRLRAWCDDVLGATFTRIDLCVDDLEGRYPVELVREAYRSGEFATGGNYPGMDQKGDWDVPGSPKGRTYYVGSRANGKLYRGYEKGKEQGDPRSAWMRHEVEFRNEKRVLPSDMLLRCEEYFAGAYGFCSKLVAAAAERVRCKIKEARVRVDALVECAKTAYGRLIDVLLEHFEGDYASVVNVLRVRGTPKRLQGIRKIVVEQAAFGYSRIAAELSGLGHFGPAPLRVGGCHAPA